MLHLCNGRDNALESKFESRFLAFTAFKREFNKNTIMQEIANWKQVNANDVGIELPQMSWVWQHKEAERPFLVTKLCKGGST